MGMQQALTGKHDTRECEVISWVFLVGAREEEVLVARSCEWFSVLIDRVGLHDPMFMVPTLSHDASDFKHMHAQSCLGTTWQTQGFHYKFTQRTQFVSL